MLSRLIDRDSRSIAMGYCAVGLFLALQIPASSGYFEGVWESGYITFRGMNVAEVSLWGWITNLVPAMVLAISFLKIRPQTMATGVGCLAVAGALSFLLGVGRTIAFFEVEGAVQIKYNVGVVLIPCIFMAVAVCCFWTRHRLTKRHLSPCGV